MSRYRDITWQIDETVANALVGSDHPTFIRGGEESLVFEFFLDETSVEATTTTTLGGADGTTLGGSSGGTLSSSPQSPEDRYIALRHLLEYDGTNAVGTTLEGEPFVREYLTSRAKVETRILRIVPGEDVRLEAGFWVAVDGGEVQTRSPGPVLLSLDVIYLARAYEYETRDELIDDLSTPITQL